MTLVSLYQLAEAESISIEVFPLHSREALSYMALDGSCYIAIDLEKLKSTQDETLKLAHEMGHCMTGSFYNKWATCDIRKKHEKRADKWAIQKLIPEDELKEALRCGYRETWELATHFDVSEDFMLKALHWYRYGNTDWAA